VPAKYNECTQSRYEKSTAWKWFEGRPDPVPPWDYRKTKRKQKKAMEDFTIRSVVILLMYSPWKERRVRNYRANQRAPSRQFGITT